MESQAAKKTALNAIHRQLGAKMVEFAGWDMPVQYAGPIPEHMAVRRNAGIFDVSHMGELVLDGPGAEESIQHVTCNDVRRLAINQVQYSALTTPRGTFVDDILVYRLGPSRFFLCVNAANQEKDYRWIKDNARPGTDVINRSDDFAQIAIQGPRAQDICAPLTEIPLASIKYYWFAQGRFAGADALVSRTGYTGEDGFEVYCPPSQAESVYLQIMESGKRHGLEPAGLAARNTLRLEAKMALYGNDIDEATTVLEADLGWICKLEKGRFIGSSTLLEQKDRGIARKLVGFEMIERGIARDHYPVEMDGRRISQVTSGSPAPFLNLKSIGLTYLPAECCSVGTEFSVIIRERPVKARVAPTPFYRRAKRA